MRKCKGMWLVFLLLLCTLPVSAATGVISISAPGGSELTLYRVGDREEQKIQLAEAFVASNLILTRVHDPEAAALLAAYAQDNAIAGLTGYCDENELVRFENLQQGVYLVVQTQSIKGFTPITPFLFSIPEGDSYALDAAPKQLPQETITQPESATPQTGDRTRVLMLLAASGVLFSLLGLMFCAVSQKNRRR